jgi:ribose-phosphate pyrophosphokinase
MFKIMRVDQLGNVQVASNGNIDSGLYPDNQPFAKYDHFGGDEQYAILYVDADPTWHFHAGMMFAQSYKEITDKPIKLVIPNFPGARQDRRNMDGDILFSAKYYADIVNSVGFSEVFVLDPHSDVTPALLDRVTPIHVGHIAQYDGLRDGVLFKEKYDAIVAPDAGAAKRAYAMAAALGVPNVIQAWKHRDTATGSITGFGVEDYLLEGNFESPRLLVVDDMCDAGGTFLGLADVLEESYGATLDLYVTHGLFTRGTTPLKAFYDKIITTNSTDSEKLNCEVIDVLDWKFYA